MEVLTLRHMFQGTLEGEHTPVFFTKDNEHLLSKLSESDLKMAKAQGWVEATEIPTMQDIRARAKEAKAAQKDLGKRGAK